MPRGDGTGPEGLGQMSGRGAGYCAGSSAPGFSSAPGGRGRGRGGRGGWGRGRGYRHCFYETGLTGWRRAALGAERLAMPAAADEQDVAMLEKQAEICERTLDELRKRILAVKSSREKTDEDNR